MKKPRLWTLGFASCLALAGSGCQTGDSGLSSVPIPAGTSQTTVQALDSSPGAQEFLARNSFEGTASLSDRSFARGQYLVFTSRLALLPGDTNNKRDIYLRDVRTGEMKVISKGLAGAQADGDSTQASISADGRFVAYRSAATNLVAGDSNGTEDIFVYNRLTGVTTRVSTDSVGTQSNGTSLTPALSASGRYVVFASAADNLATTDGNAKQDIFVKDTTTGATTLVSSNSALTDSANGASYDPAITEGTTTEGEFIAFATEATDIVGGGLNGQRQIVRVERATPANRLLVSRSAGGAQADGPSYEPSMSTDGSKVAFFTLASNIGPTPDTNSFFDVYLRDIGGNTTTCQSLDSLNNESDNHSGYPSLSADGTVVAFGSLATDLVAGDTNGRFDVFRRATGSTTRVSVSTSGGEANSDSDIPALSQDGRWVAFRSAAGNVVTHDSTTDDDIFVRDTATPSTFWASISCVFPAIWPGFELTYATSASSLPRGAASADLDGDGDLDIVIPSSGDDNIAVLLNNGDRTFAPAVSYGPSFGADSAAIGDLDNDGDLDIAVSDRFGGRVTIYKNSGNGTFTGPTTVSIGTNPFCVALGDFNQDGLLDICTANIDTNDATVILNDDGTFTAPTLTNFAAGDGPRQVVTGDFDGINGIDIAVSNYGVAPSYNTASISVLLNNGSGSFSGTNIATVLQAYPIATADMDSDGDLDIVVASGNTSNGTIHFNQGGGVFSAASPVFDTGASSGSLAIAVADLDGDLDQDIAATSYTGDSVNVLQNDGANNFSIVERLPGKGPTTLVVNDFDNDGKLDIVGMSQTTADARLFLSNGDGTHLPYKTYPAGQGIQAVTAGDFTGDGYPDLCGFSDISNSITLLKNDGTGDFSPLASIVAGFSPKDGALGDLDGDGDLDLVACTVSGNGLRVMLNSDGVGSFGAPVGYAIGSSPRGVALADFNLDGHLDVVTANSGSGDLSILLNNGDGTLGAASGYGAGTTPYSVVAGDFNGDGYPDLAACNNGSGDVSVLLNNQDGTFAAAVNYAVGSSPVNLAAADINGDGLVDIVVSNSSFASNSVSVLMNNAGSIGTFQSAVNTTLGYAPGQLALGDTDGDGDLDVVVPSNYNNELYVLYNDGVGTLSSTNAGGIFSQPYATQLVDVDLDGDLDTVVGCRGFLGSSQICVHKNKACP